MIADLSEILADMSHALRTPIAAIQASVETLRRGVDDARDRADFIRIIDEHSARLGSLVDDLLLVAELESRKARAQPAAVVLGGFAQELLKAVRPIARRKGMSVRFAVADDLAAWADPSHLTRIMRILAENALKRGEKGGTVVLQAGRWKGRLVRISLRSAAPSVRVGGLTFHIVKTMARSNGGRVWTEPGTNGSSLVHLSLPSPPSQSPRL